MTEAPLQALEAMPDEAPNLSCAWAVLVALMAWVIERRD